MVCTVASTINAVKINIGRLQVARTIGYKTMSSIIMKHGWLVLFFLLAIHTNLTGCSKSIIYLDDDDVPVHHHDIDIPFDDEDDDHTTAAATRKIKATNQSVTFLRKNTYNTKEVSNKGKDIFQKACSKAIGGGVPGAVAGVVQVLSLMWLVRTFIVI